MEEIRKFYFAQKDGKRLFSLYQDKGLKPRPLPGDLFAVKVPKEVQDLKQYLIVIESGISKIDSLLMNHNDELLLKRIKLEIESFPEEEEEEEEDGIECLEREQEMTLGERDEPFDGIHIGMDQE